MTIGASLFWILMNFYTDLIPNQSLTLNRDLYPSFVNGEELIDLKNAMNKSLNIFIEKHENLNNALLPDARKKV